MCWICLLWIRERTVAFGDEDAWNTCPILSRIYPLVSQQSHKSFKTATSMENDQFLLVIHDNVYSIYLSKTVMLHVFAMFKQPSGRPASWVLRRGIATGYIIHKQILGGSKPTKTDGVFLQDVMDVHPPEKSININLFERQECIGMSPQVRFSHYISLFTQVNMAAMAQPMVASGPCYAQRDLRWPNLRHGHLKWDQQKGHRKTWTTGRPRGALGSCWKLLGTGQLRGRRNH